MTLLAAGACGGSPAVPDVVDPGWRQPGELDIRFTVAKPRTSIRVHAVLSLDDAGRVRALRTAQSADGVVAVRTDWTGGPTGTSASAPGCTTAAEPMDAPGSVAGWLAEPFGPVDAATAAGWTVDGETATRPGSLAETVERASLTPLATRVVREVERDSGAVVSEVSGITIRHTATGPALPSCGKPWIE
jgi:hypothetical protein